MSEHIIEFIINLFAGIIGILVVLWIESFRRPGITMKVGDIHIIEKKDLLGRRHTKFLRVEICNRDVPKLLEWFYDGEPALSCKGWITFRDNNGSKILQEEMKARWSSSIQPKVESAKIENLAPGRCIDHGLIYRLYGANLSGKQDKGQRMAAGCLCQQSVDVGSYREHPCLCGCLYCYANPVVKPEGA